MLARIAAEQPVPADIDEIAEHQQAIAKHADFCARIVRPANRHFGGPQAVATREKQYLRVETESLDSLLLENDAAGLPHECLEPALRIVDGQTSEKPHKTVEDDPGDLAKAGLAREDERAIERARSDGNVVPARIALRSFSDSSIGDERSASVKRAIRPLASSIPWRTL